MMYCRVSKMGPPRKINSLSDRELIQRFWSKVDARHPDECWEWCGHITPYGYGDFQLNRKTIHAHRLAKMLMMGTWLNPEQCVLHDCPKGDNPRCVNPTHLWIGTKAENQRDMKKKGRGRPGTRKKKISDEDVAIARSLFRKGWTIANLSKKYSVSFTHMGYIVANKVRKGVKACA